MCPEWRSGDDIGRHPGLADHGVVHLPARVGQGLSRALRPPLPAQRPRLVRQVQVVLRVAPGRPRGRRQGEDHLTVDGGCGGDDDERHVDEGNDE